MSFIVRLDLRRIPPSFVPAGAEAFKRDLPNAVVKFVDSGHFALESHHTEIACYIKDFLR